MAYYGFTVQSIHGIKILMKQDIRLAMLFKNKYYTVDLNKYFYRNYYKMH